MPFGLAIMCRLKADKKATRSQNFLLSVLMLFRMKKRGEALCRKAFPVGREAVCPSAGRIARDEPRHGRGLEGLLKRYFDESLKIRREERESAPLSAGR